LLHQSFGVTDVIDVLMRQQDVADVARFEPDLAQSCQHALAASRHPGVHKHRFLAQDDVHVAASHLFKQMHTVSDLHAGRPFARTPVAISVRR
jgi:hypothetical protein